MTDDAAPTPRSWRVGWPGWRSVLLGLAAVLLVLGLAYWVQTTRPADPLMPGDGIGWEGTGYTQVPVGHSAAFVWYLVGRDTHSHATVTGVTIPPVAGLRLAVDTVVGP